MSSSSSFLPLQQVFPRPHRVVIPDKPPVLCSTSRFLSTTYSLFPKDFVPHSLLPQSPSSFPYLSLSLSIYLFLLSLSLSLSLYLLSPASSFAEIGIVISPVDTSIISICYDFYFLFSFLQWPRHPLSPPFLCSRFIPNLPLPLTVISCIHYICDK